MSNQKKVFIGILAIVTGITIYVIRNYLGVIAIACLVVLMFNPIYKRFLRYFKGKRSIASSLTMIIVLLSFVVPIALIGGLITYQVTQVAADLQNLNFTSSSLGQITESSLKTINDNLKASSINYEVTPEQLNNTANQSLRSGGGLLLNYGGNLGARIPEYLTDIILFFIMLGFLFPAQDQILKTFKKLSPLSEEINRIYLARSAAMARSMINGTFVVAAVQAIVGGITLWFLGVPYALFFTFLLFVFSIIPVLGSGIVLVPMGLILLITGNILGGVIILLMQFLVISNIDNVLRPKLVEQDARLPEAITLLGILSGLSVFGIIGLVFGPVIIVIAYTTYEIYLNYYAISVKNFLNQDEK